MVFAACGRPKPQPPAVIVQASLGKFPVVANDIMDQSTEGGEDSLFYEGDQLRKVVYELLNW